MNFKSLFKYFAVMVIAVFVWNTDAMGSVREKLRDFLNLHSSQQVKPIRWDNDIPSSVPRENKFIVTEIPKERGFRKCQRGSEIVYTNDLCPEGAQEIKVGEKAVSVKVH